MPLWADSVRSYDTDAAISPAVSLCVPPRLCPGSPETTESSRNAQKRRAVLDSKFWPQVWSTHLNQPPDVFAACRSVMSATELERVHSISNPASADAFILRRGTLRHLLSHVLDRPPLALDVLADGYGKPHLADRSLEFNVSSSRDLALFALSNAGPVGVDVEWINPDFEFVRLLADNFTQSELEILRGQAQELFFQAWTLKEACAKALGQGLSFPLREIDVLTSNKVRISGFPVLVTSSLPLPASYRGALASVKM